MSALPENAARTIAKGVAAYVRATGATELPPSLAALKKTVQTPKGEARHRAQLLGVLDDDPLRALILEWLDDGKPALSKDEIATLRIAADRPENWKEQLARKVPSPRTQTKPAANVVELERKLEREKEAHKKAREEAKRAKEAERRAIKVERTRSLRLDEEVGDQKRRIGELEEDLKKALAGADKAIKELERVKRKARSDVDGLRQQVRKLRDENRVLKKAQADVERAAAAKAKAKARKKADAEKEGIGATQPQKARGPRSVLNVPKGRLEDAPETLEAWLAAEGVTLLVDGYNVTRSGSGFGHLSLEQQRDRLRDLLKKLSNRLKVPTLIVWDGGEVPPGTKRPTSGFLTEEYSEPDRSGTGNEKDRADKHLVALLSELPPDPVILVTNDRGLQGEARPHKATIASSDQLLALLR